MSELSIVVYEANVNGGPGVTLTELLRQKVTELDACESAKVKIGRARECDINIASVDVSRQQGEFEIIGSGFATLVQYTNLSSLGTYLNGHILSEEEPVTLHLGDRLEFGETINEEQRYVWTPIADSPPMINRVRSKVMDGITYIREVRKNAPEPILKYRIGIEK